MALRWTVPVPLETRSRMDIQLSLQDVREKCLNLVLFLVGFEFRVSLPERIYEESIFKMFVSISGKLCKEVNNS